MRLRVVCALTWDSVYLLVFGFDVYLFCCPFVACIFFFFLFFYGPFELRENRVDLTQN